MIELAPTYTVQKIVLSSSTQDSAEIIVRESADALPIELFQAMKGDKGDKGDSGSGGAGGTFVFPQASALSVWEIYHNLGKFPSATVIDSSGDTVLVPVQYLDENNVRLTFSAPTSGTAYLN